jgi:hypothetical protein
MNESKQLDEAKSLIQKIGDFLKLSDVPKEETKEEEVVLAEEPTEEEPKEEEPKEESVVEDGAYELADGRELIIKDGVVVEVAEAEAKEEGAPEAVEEEMAKEEPVEKAELSEAKKEIENLKSQLEKLSAVKEEVEPIVAAPIKKEKAKIELSANMTYKERVLAQTLNNLNR